MRSLKIRLWIHRILYNTRFLAAYMIFRSLALPINTCHYILAGHMRIRHFLVTGVIRDGSIDNAIDAEYIRSYRVRKTLALPEDSDIIMKMLRL